MRRAGALPPFGPLSERELAHRQPVYGSAAWVSLHRPTVTVRILGSPTRPRSFVQRICRDRGEPQTWAAPLTTDAPLAAWLAAELTERQRVVMHDAAPYQLANVNRIEWELPESFPQLWIGLWTSPDPAEGRLQAAVLIRRGSTTPGKVTLEPDGLTVFVTD